MSSKTFISLGLKRVLPLREGTLGKDLRDITGVIDRKLIYRGFAGYSASSRDNKALFQVRIGWGCRYHLEYEFVLNELVSSKRPAKSIAEFSVNFIKCS